MGDTISSHASAMDVESQDASEEADAAKPAAVAQSATDGQPAADLLDITGFSGVATTPPPGTLQLAEALPGLLAIEDGKPDEHYQASGQIRGALNNLPEQLQQEAESQMADWTHSTVEYPANLWMSCEYAMRHVREQEPASIWTVRSSISMLITGMDMARL